MDVLTRGEGAPDFDRETAARTGELERTPSLSTEVLLAQLRAVVVDLLQVTGFSLDEDYAVSYAYDNLGRFASVTSHSPLATSDFSRHPATRSRRPSRGA